MTFRSTPITGDNRKKLMRWLMAPEASVFVSILETEADLNEASAVATKMQELVAVIQGDGDVQAVQDRFVQAAKLRLAVAVFREIQSRNEFAIHTPHARPTAGTAGPSAGTEANADA